MAEKSKRRMSGLHDYTPGNEVVIFGEIPGPRKSQVEHPDGRKDMDMMRCATIQKAVKMRALSVTP
jgi:hypothetical protein